MIGDTLSDAVISINEYLEAGMVIKDLESDVRKLVADMDAFRERYDAASLPDLPPPPGAVVLVLDGVGHRLSAGVDPVCPACGHGEVSMWADDGEADAADWWQCELFSGGCGATGAVCPEADTTRTQNGLPAGGAVDA